MRNVTQHTARWFTDDSKYLDRFGLLLVLAFASVTVNSLIDLDNATADLRAELGWIVTTFFVSATVVLAVRASGLARKPRIIVDIVAVGAMLGSVLFTVLDSVSSETASLSSARPSWIWVFIAAIAPFLVVRRILRHRKVTKQTLYGAVAAYLLFALAFQYAFLTVDSVMAEPFFAQSEPTTSFMYFSLVSITTVGYGDLAAVGDLGRYLATTEAILGQVFLVVIVARLVSLFGVAPGEASNGPEPTPTPRN